MSQYVFGSGVLWGTPLTDSAGNAIANPTPVIFGVLQEASVDISFENKTLHGQNQFPVAVGRGKGKVSGKAKAAKINGAILNNIVFGQTVTNGIQSAVYDTTGATIPATPFTITPTIPGSGTWLADLGVVGPNGEVFTKVASAPTANQYSVAAGVYTFAAADTGKKVFISFSYTGTSTTAPKSTVTNQLMGYAPTFKADLYMPYNGKSLLLSLPACISTKLTMATKLDDFMVPEFDFEAFADASGNVLSWATSE